MLDFPLELESPLFMNARAMDNTMAMCKAANMPWEMCLEMMKAQFPEMNRLQFMEVKYESSECFCVRRARPRQQMWEYTRESSHSVRQMLEARNQPGFSTPEKFIQVVGRAVRGDSFDNLIGEEMRIKIDNIKKDRKND